MGAMEVTKGDEKVQEDGGSMPRAPSVDDLFGPMGRLDMHSLGAGTGNEREKASLSNLCPVSNSGTAVKASSSPPGGAIGKCESITHRFRSGAAVLCKFTCEKDSEKIVDGWLLKTSCAGAQLGLNLNQTELSGLSRDSCGEHVNDSREGDTTSPRKNNPEGQSNFTSDEDKSIINERRQKRMISNRESARRSRLRKQQHLDELRSQIAHLQAENSHLVNRYSLASQQYVQLNEENSVLRSNATNLRHQLDMLHHGTFNLDLL